jgi:peptide/nickel transport system permease protein
VTATAPLPDPLLTPAVEILETGSGRTNLLRRMLRNPLAAVAMAWLVILVLSALFAGVIAPGDPSSSSVKNSLAPPGPGFPLGADRAGHNVWIQLVHAGQFSLLAPLASIHR